MDMIMKYIAAAALGSLLAGCGTTHLSNELAPYVGKNLQELVSHLGRPNGELESTGDHVYVWLTDSDGVLPGSPALSASGDGGSGSYAGHRTNAALMPVHYKCRLEVTVDSHDVVLHYEVEGSNVGCRPLTRQMSR
jgi:hypothetical protein